MFVKHLMFSTEKNLKFDCGNLENILEIILEYTGKSVFRFSGHSVTISYNYSLIFVYFEIVISLQP